VGTASLADEHPAEMIMMTAAESAAIQELRAFHPRLREFLLPQSQPERGRAHSPWHGPRWQSPEW
jgi:hypothetical protein